MEVIDAVGWLVFKETPQIWKKDEGGEVGEVPGGPTRHRPGLTPIK